MQKKKRREDEIDKITSVLSKRAKKEDTSHVLLGDFNIPNLKDPMMGKLEQYGFSVPKELKDHPTDLGQQKHYDQIAFNLQLCPTMSVFSVSKKTPIFSELIFGRFSVDPDDGLTFSIFSQFSGKFFLQELKTY